MVNDNNNNYYISFSKMCSEWKGALKNKNMFQEFPEWSGEMMNPAALDLWAKMTV